MNIDIISSLISAFFLSIVAIIIFLTMRSRINFFREAQEIQFLTDKKMEYWKNKCNESNEKFKEEGLPYRYKVEKTPSGRYFVISFVSEGETNVK